MRVGWSGEYTPKGFSFSGFVMKKAVVAKQQFSAKMNTCHSVSRFRAIAWFGQLRHNLANADL